MANVMPSFSATDVIDATTDANFNTEDSEDNGGEDTTTTTTTTTTMQTRIDTNNNPVVQMQVMDVRDRIREE